MHMGFEAVAPGKEVLSCCWQESRCGNYDDELARGRMKRLVSSMLGFFDVATAKQIQVVLQAFAAKPIVSSPRVLE
jgi:hypothetical protein